MKSVIFFVLMGALAVSTGEALDVTVPLGGNIQTAINQVNAAGGGSVILQAGTYTNSVPLNMESFVTLTGQGPSSTTITNSSFTNVIQQASEGLANVTIANLRVTGKHTNTCYGILLQALSTYHTNILITNVEVTACGMGVHLKRVCGVTVTGCNFHDNGTTYTNDFYYFHNLYIRQCDNTNYSIMVTNCQLNNGLSGNGLNLSYNVNIFVENTTATNNWFRGIRAADSTNFTVLNCTVSGNGDVGLIANAEIVPTQNIYWDSNVADNNGNGGLTTVSGVTGTAVGNDACDNTPANYSFQGSVTQSGNTTCENVTWNGGSLASGNWSDKTNWNGSTVASGDLLFFAGTTRLNNTNNFSSYSFSGLTFNSGAGLFNLNGNTFDLTGGITNNSTSGQTINNNITFSAGNHVIYTPASTANITNNGNLGEDGSGPVTLTYSTPGSKTLVLNGSNSITGGFTFTGTSTTQFGLVLGNTNALGTNWVNITSGALNFFAVAPGANPFVIANPVFTNSRDAYFNGSNVLFTGQYFEGGAGKALSVASGQTVTFNSGLYNLAASYSYKAGPGTLVLNGALAGGQGTLVENGVSYATSFYMRYLSGAGTVVLGNSGAVGSSSQYFVIDAGGSAIMANTDLSGANAITANVVLSAATSGIGLTIGGTNNITFSGNLYVSIGTAGAVTRYLIVTNTGATAFSGSVNLSDGPSPGTLSVNVADTSGGVAVSGSIADGVTPGGSLILTNAGGLTLSGANTYTGPTVVSNGTLVVNGSLANGAVNVYGGTLAGTGTLNGPTTVFGGTLSPAGNGVIGTLTISNSLNLLGTLAVDINKTAGTNDLITGLTSVAYGGTLAVNNLSGSLTTSDSFKLFNAGSYSGSFANITPATPGAGLAWNTSTLTTDGTLRVASVSAPLTSMAFTVVPVISGTSLTISATNTGAGTVYLLASTNLATPLNSWTPIWTNVLSGSGSFTTNLANAVNQAVNQQFYLLSNTND